MGWESQSRRRVTESRTPRSSKSGWPRVPRARTRWRIRSTGFDGLGRPQETRFSWPDTPWLGVPRNSCSSQEAPPE